jgi:hypothetical protein
MSGGTEKPESSALRRAHSFFLQVLLQTFWQVALALWLFVNGAWRWFMIVVGRDSR